MASSNQQGGHGLISKLFLGGSCVPRKGRNPRGCLILHVAWIFLTASQQIPREIPALWKSNGFQKEDGSFWVRPSMFLLVRMFRTEIFCFENLGFVLLVGLMLFSYMKSNHHHFCSIQDRFPSIDTGKCHWWVCWLDASGENPPLAFSSCVKTVRILKCSVFLAIMCQLDK